MISLPETAALACCAALGLIAALSIPEPAPTITVTDGDSLTVNGQRVRLSGIDAPEASQTCLDAQGRSWGCGEAATAFLRGMILADPNVTCERKDTDRYSRMVALCRNSTHGDLGARLVARGLAVAYRRYSSAYVDHEDAARAERLGMWAGRFVTPEQYRRGGR